MAVEELLDLARIDVLAAADHHVLQAADDVDVALLVHGREIAGVHPARLVDRLGGLLRVVPVALHHRIAAGAELAGLAARHRLALGIDDLDLDVRQHLAHGRDAPLQRIVGGALRGHRRGLGHAVGDGDLAHVHVALHLLHHLDRAGRARHDAGAQALEVELRELGMVELGDEHGGHAVERRAALLGDGLQGRQRIERLGGIDHGRAVRQAAEIAHHHAEAVIERHGDAQPVVRRELQPLADEVAVVQDVVVAERGALGKARRARGELDVDGVVELQLRRRARRASPSRHCRRPVATSSKFSMPGVFSLPRRTTCLRCGSLPAFTRSVDDLEIVRGLERRRQDQRLALDLVHRVLELGAPVGRVDVDQDQARLGGGELGQRPFGAVGRPDADAIAALQPQRQQAGGEIVDPPPQLAPASSARSDAAPPAPRGRGRSRPVRSKKAPMVSPISFLVETPWS